MTEGAPLVTLVVLSYNQAQFIADAVRGAFAQTYTPLEIILSDDASSDETYELVQELAADYVGPHRLILNRNRINLGIGAHVNKVMELAEGQIIVASAGDDISDSNRVDAIVSAFCTSTDRALSVWSGARYIDDCGKLIQRAFPGRPKNFSDRTMVQNIRPVIGATHAWRREVFDFFGPLASGVMFEDNAISFRSYLIGSIIYIDQELVSYRTHVKNISNFTQIADFKKLYAAAAQRARWALSGLAQRKQDLSRAISEQRIVAHRDATFLTKELNRLEVVYNRRLARYTEFPTINWSLFIGACRDAEIAKVLLRSLLRPIIKRVESK